MLKTVITSGRRRLEVLADSWLADGARQVVVRGEEKVLAWWPHHLTPPAASDLEAPLIVSGRRIGTLQVVGLHGPGFQGRLEADAGLLAYAVELEQELEELAVEMLHQQEQLVGLYKLTQSTRQQIRIDDIGRSLVEAAHSLVPSEWAFAVLEEPEGGNRVLAEPAGASSSLQPEFIKGLTQQNASLLANDMEAGAAAGLALPATIEQLLFVPIYRAESLRLGIGLVNKRHGRFESPDQKLVQALAEQAGAQIENVLLHQELLAQTRLQTEMDLARQVQLRLLPGRPPEVEGLDIFAQSRPAFQVGGDFYDFLVTDGNSLYFALGDVSGKGLPAAMLMAISRTALRSTASRLGGAQPAAILAETNQDLYDDFTEVGMFATVLVGQYASADRQLWYVNAGQSPVIYRPAGGGARFLATSGPAMGVLRKSLAQDRRLDWRPGDILVVASDGFSEARDGHGNLFGHQRLMTLVDQLAGQPARVVAGELFAAVNRHSGGQHQSDDQTVVVLRGS